MYKFGHFAFRVFTVFVLFNQYYSYDANNATFICPLISSNITELPTINHDIHSIGYSELLKNCPYIIIINLLVLIILCICLKNPEHRKVFVKLLNQIIQNQQAPSPITLNVKYGKSIKEKNENEIEITQKDFLFDEENDNNKKKPVIEI